jgi:hypothetical protein
MVLDYIFRKRQKGVAWSKFVNFTAQASESGIDLVTRFDGNTTILENMFPLHRYLASSLQSKGTHHQFLATTISTNPCRAVTAQEALRATVPSSPKLI